VGVLHSRQQDSCASQSTERLTPQATGLLCFAVYWGSYTPGNRTPVLRSLLSVLHSRQQDSCASQSTGRLTLQATGSLCFAVYCPALLHYTVHANCCSHCLTLCLRFSSIFMTSHIRMFRLHLPFGREKYSDYNRTNDRLLSLTDSTPLNTNMTPLCKYRL
jgi:hypothetical protein